MSGRFFVGIVLGLVLGFIVGHVANLGEAPDPAREDSGAGPDVASDLGTQVPATPVPPADGASALLPAPRVTSEPAPDKQATAPVPTTGAAGPVRVRRPRLYLKPATPDTVPDVLEARVRLIAERIRESGRQRIADAEDVAREGVRREVAEERARREDLTRGGVMAWLRGLERDWHAPWEMLSDAGKYGAIFKRQAKGRTLDGATLFRGMVLADGDTLHFAAGRHLLDTRILSRLDPFPKDLLISGSGMDQTLIVLKEAFRMRGDVHGLRFRDLTIDCGRNSLEDLRSEPYTLRVERCRILGCDRDMLSGNVCAFYASDSRIEAGFGRSAEGGNLFDVRGALVARLENCDIVGPFRGVFDQGSDAAQVFDRCRFTSMKARFRSAYEKPGEAVRLVNCTVVYMPAGSPTPKKRSLGEINATWESKRPK
jgi:hypothetical protein